MLKASLEFLSLGKHPTMLYFNGKEEYSSWQGGIMTILQVALTVAISFSVMQSPIKRDVYTLTEDSIKFADTSYFKGTY